MEILRKTGFGHEHWCPACEQMHPLPLGWTFNGDMKKPTFNPSFKHKLSHWTGGYTRQGEGLGVQVYRICHYIITDGKIQFCPDSWHVRSDIISMPLIPDPVRDFGCETQD